MVGTRWAEHLIQDPVDSVSHAQVLLVWFYVDIACTLLRGLGDNHVHEFDYGRLVGEVEQVAAFLEGFGGK